MKFIVALLTCLLYGHTLFSQRIIINLNGTWDIEESLEAWKIPSHFSHNAEVPGLINQSIPAFAEVDKFYSREYCENIWVRPNLEQNILLHADTSKIGYTPQKRNYFWYRRQVTIDKKKECYILKVNKAQFGTSVWVNGKKAGESLSCFTAQYYDISVLLKVPGKNEIVIRVGAHPGVLPTNVPAGTDYEKRHWTPGIYDDVSLICTNYPYIENIQVAPDINKSEITVESLILTKPGQGAFDIVYKVNEWKSGREAGATTQRVSSNITGATGVIQRIAIPEAKLWSPEDPFLYTIDVSTGSDNITTRFGMREFRFDTPTKRAYLNNKLIYLRGSNITLHRFFDDSLCQNKPWDEQWARKLLTELPSRYHWNSFRFCIGPVPDKWLDIADEVGLLIQNEYFIWSYRSYWDSTLLKNHIKEWMRDCWNHPSVAWWDIANETRNDILTNIIHDVRPLDLSNRAWDNGYNFPEGNNDPVEDHHYLMYAYMYEHLGTWDITRFEKGTGEKSTNSAHPTAHACVLNEYGWLWLKRNGQQTLLTSPAYNTIAKGYTNEQRQELYAYLLAAETEYFRAHRNYAGVLHFTYLTGDFIGAITGDLFKDPGKLEVVKVYDDYFKETFKPLGVYVNFFPISLKPDTSANIAVMLVNDEYHDIKGKISMTLFNRDNEKVVIASTPFSIGKLSQETCSVKLQFPAIPGEYWLKTMAVQENGEETLCRRKILIK